MMPIFYKTKCLSYVNVAHIVRIDIGDDAILSNGERLTLDTDSAGSYIIASAYYLGGIDCDECADGEVIPTIPDRISNPILEALARIDKTLSFIS